MGNTDINASAFGTLLARGEPVLIDGGFATQCEAMGCDIDGELWSARLLRDDPDAVVAAHRAFLDAGARIIATASYQASRHGFAKAGVSAAEADRLILASVSLAERARDTYLGDNPDAPRPLLAASMGPWGAILHDGSEYTGAYDASASTLRDFHERRIAVFDDSGADLLAFETIPSGEEAFVLADLLANTGKPSWVSFSCRDEHHLADGTPLADAAAPFCDHETVLAIGVNCVAPALIVPLIRELKPHVGDKAIIAYPNSGEVYRADDNSWHGTATPLQCGRAVVEWLEAGARLVGGCCRTGPQHIAAMATAISERATITHA